MVPYFNNLLFLSLLVLGCASFLCIMLYGDPRNYIKKYGRIYQHRKYNQDIQQPKIVHSANATSKIFYSDDEIRKMEKSEAVKKCPAHPFLGSNSSHIWIEKDNLPYYNLSTSTPVVCCYKSFYRPKRIDDITAFRLDNRVKYNPCRDFSNYIAVEDEFVRVNCSCEKKISDYFFLFARYKPISVKPRTDLPYNILVLGIDSVSRLNLHRTMPKTVKLLRKLGAVEMLRYNKVGENTFPNVVPLLVGKHVSELPETCWSSKKVTFDNCPFIWYRFQQEGFTTAYIEDYTKIGTFNYMRRGFAGFPTDYYLRTFLFEAETYARGKKNKPSPCINEKYTFKIVLDYVEALTSLSKINRLFGFFWENTMTHDFLNYPSVMDNDYTAFFEKLHRSGYLNNSIVFLLSDHGMRWGQFRKTKQGFLEARLPFVFALMPPSFRKKFSEAYKNLVQNVHRLTTPFDMHATLIDLVNLYIIENSKISSRTYDSNQRSISLFLPIPENRTCESAAIDGHWCVDHGNTKVDSNSTVAREAVEYAMSHLNDLLKEYPQCAGLTLDKVLIATRLLYDNTKGNIKKSVELTVTFRTNPGGGEFEATLGRQGGPGSHWFLLGSVSRINLYGNQSYCIKDHGDVQLLLYCYCIISRR